MEMHANNEAGINTNIQNHVLCPDHADSNKPRSCRQRNVDNPSVEIKVNKSHK
jgi:hypothetical protein